MNYQLNFFGLDQKQQEAQKKFLRELINLKRLLLQEQEFHNFFGTAEAITVKEQELAKKMTNYVSNLQKAFPQIELEEFL